MTQAIQSLRSKLISRRTFSGPADPDHWPDNTEDEGGWQGDNR